MTLPMMHYIVSGVDPGPDRCGYALLEVLVASGKLASASIVDGSWRPADAYRHGLTPCSYVFVERPSGVKIAAASNALLDTAIVAGEWYANLQPASYYITLAQWRGALLRTATGSDKQVRALVDGLAACGFLTGLEHVNHEARPHVYDAIGAALGGLVHYGVAKIVLPSSVEVDILKAKANDKQKRKAKAARKSRVVGR
jgi:hypothetical protein